LSDERRVAVKFLNCQVFLHLYLLFYYNFLTVVIMIVGMLKGIKFNSGLNIYGTIILRYPNSL